MTTPDTAVFRLRDAFIGWQCRIRQHAMRMDGGRPPLGARAAVDNLAGARIAEAVTMMIVKREPQDDTAQFRHMATQTHDPSERYRKALDYLRGAYYQRSRDFSDGLTALFAQKATLATNLLREGGCTLNFSQFQQRFHIPCAVTEAGPEHPAWQATYWHNALFNPRLPPDIRILLFRPRWLDAMAEPPPT